MPTALGLDIGGANLKAVHCEGIARTVPFALWKDPAGLPDKLREILASLPPAGILAVTMTGELCDCFASKREGVTTILKAVTQVAHGREVQVWTTAGNFVGVEDAVHQPLTVAAGNWLALASWVCREFCPSAGLLFDIGSTTADIIPLQKGRPVPRGLTDPERLAGGELVYTGVRRTPLCALLGFSAAAEWFATTLDIYLLLGLVPEDPLDRDTADGRPATCAAAHARLAHMLCADAETCSEEQTRQLALRAMEIQVHHLRQSVERITANMSQTPQVIVLAGSGEFLARKVVEDIPSFSKVKVVSLADTWGLALSEAACAYAVVNLAQDSRLQSPSPLRVEGLG